MSGAPAWGGAAGMHPTDSSAAPRAEEPPGGNFGGGGWNSTWQMPSGPGQTPPQHPTGAGAMYGGPTPSSPANGMGLQPRSPGAGQAGGAEGAAGDDMGRCAQL